MFIAALFFILGLLLLIRGGDWFVDGACGIAHRFSLPELLIGATVVSIGTTLPEVMVSSASALSGHGALAYGNAVGSIICNAALIAALTITVRPGITDPRALRLPVIFFFAATAVYFSAAYGVGFFGRGTGFFLLALFILYMILTVYALRTSDSKSSTYAPSSDTGHNRVLLKDIFLLCVGAVLIAFGADLLVDNGTKIAEGLGVPESVIALTFVALGTSLPELVTAVTALVKGHSTLSLGNVIGANLFNLVLVSGISAVLSPFPIPVEKKIGGFASSLVLDLPVMLFAMLLLTVPVFFSGKLSRLQGILLLCLYGIFCAVQFLI